MHRGFIIVHENINFVFLNQEEEVLDLLIRILFKEPLPKTILIVNNKENMEVFPCDEQ